MSKFRFALPALAASLVLAMGTGAYAERTSTDGTSLAPGNYTFATSLTPRTFGVGSYLGILNLRVSADGTVGGYFRYEDSSQSATVVGGLTNGNLWIDYGPGLGSNHIVGHIENGKIVGTTYFSGQTYDFVGSQRSPAI
jgi:hypothetical protein